MLLNAPYYIDAVGGSTPIPAAEDITLIIIGQSKAVGRTGPIDAVLDATSANVFSIEFPSVTVVTAADPLDHFDVTSNTIGPGISIGKRHFENTGFDTYIIPAADGGTGFLADDWVHNESLYQNALNRIEAAWTAIQAVNPNTTPVIWWDQGEDDAGDYDARGVEYGSMQRHFLRQFRNDLTMCDQDTPILVSGLMDAWISTPAYGAEVEAAIAATGTFINRCAYVSWSGLASEPGDDIHPSAVSSRAMGLMLADAITTAEANIVVEPTFTNSVPSLGAGESHVLYLDNAGAPSGWPIEERTGAISHLFPSRTYYEDGKFRGEAGGTTYRIEIAAAEVVPIEDLDFEIEVKDIYYPAGTLSGNVGHVSNWISSSGNRSFLLRTDDGEVQFYGSRNGSTADLLLSYSSLSIETDYTIRITRVGDILTLYINEVEEDSIDLSTIVAGYTFNTPTPAQNWLIGSYDSSGNSFKGRWSSTRVTIST